jgi:hypothetical protein
LEGVEISSGFYKGSALIVELRAAYVYRRLPKEPVQ